MPNTNLPTRPRRLLTSTQQSLFTTSPPAVALPPDLRPKLLPLLMELLRGAADRRAVRREQDGLHE